MQSHVAFHLTGKRMDPDLGFIDKLDLRPAQFARYRDLSRLRYDFPVVLGDSIESLTNLITDAAELAAASGDADRIKKHAVRLEQEIRARTMKGERSTLSDLWTASESVLSADVRASSGKLRKLVGTDGEVIDCDGLLPRKLVSHAWSLVQGNRRRDFLHRVDRLIFTLRGILKADEVRSEKGRTPESLMAGVGAAQAAMFDFDAMSSLLNRSVPGSSLPESRRRRIQWLLDVLTSQRFFTDQDLEYEFSFDRCDAALAAFRERLPKATELAKAMEMAALEVAGEYDEAKHDPLFADFGAGGLDSADLAGFPHYLVIVKSEELSAAELDRLGELLNSGLAFKVLLVTDDILSSSPVAGEHLNLGGRNRQLVSAALAQTDVFVLQSPASHVVQLLEAIQTGLDYAGPALFSVYSGANRHTSKLPAYLVSAAALESRAFPGFVYDPAAGDDMASRFQLVCNPQSDREWPVHAFSYEDEKLQRNEEEIAFTLVDFVACDRRFIRHFASVPRETWNGSFTAVPDSLSRPGVSTEKVPHVLMVDASNRLHKVLVDETLIRETRRCAAIWRSLQEQGGIHNSFAEKAVAEQTSAWEERLAQELAAHRAAPEPTQAAAPAAASPGEAPAAAVAEPEIVEERKSDEAYIETPRCTSCNECTQLNNKMFGYNENKQAFIADLKAGTYRQLVEAAENCQVSIIHPGKPWNPDEPGLDELMKRAEPFL